MAESPKIAVERVVLSEAAEIAGAREKCLILHATSDIDAAGDEVEICVRNLLRKRLGHNYYVGHGHIVDADWKVSPQLDVIIADSSVVPAIFKSENGTEYFPYESVYAVGEIKATYRKSKSPIAQFVKSCRAIDELKRADVPANYIRAHSGGFFLGDGFTASDRHGKQNNIFTFMLFAGVGDFDPQDVSKFYSETELSALPSAVCLLDKGLIVRTLFDTLTSDGTYTHISVLNCPARPPVKDGRTFAWTLYSNGEGEPRALSWGVLYGMLVQHLMNTTVKPESPINYLQGLATTPTHVFLSEPQPHE